MEGGKIIGKEFKKPKKIIEISEDKLRIITINIPNVFDEILSKLQELGIIESRSDGLRQAISEFLVRELQFNKLLKRFGGVVR